MPAPTLASGLVYKGAGALGHYKPDGTQMAMTLGGQRQSVSSSSPTLFSAMFPTALPFLYMVTTNGSSKHGTTAIVGTCTSTKSSSDAYLSSYKQIATSSLGTSPVGETLPTLFHAVFSPLAPYSSLPSPFPLSLSPSSMIPLKPQQHEAQPQCT
jgi:hypothetical protein